jgi:DNA-binding CsgD family transcriptional regulator/tetratricopeptide (TPR) repeat protein
VPDARPTLQMAAGEASARGAPAAAAALLRRALEEPLEDQQRVSVLMALGAAETELAQPSAADRFIEAASMISDPDARFEAALAACGAATLDAARGMRSIALLDSTQPIPGDRESQIRAMNARLTASFSDPVRQHELAAAAEALGPIPGETEAERRLLAWLARLRLERGENAERVAEVAERAVGDLFDETHSTIGILIALTQTDRLALAGQLADRAIQRAQERGSPQLYISAMSWRGRIARIRGDLPVAEGFARAALDAAEGASGGWHQIGAGVLIATLIDQGRIDEADAVWAGMGLGEVLPPQRPLTVLLQIRGRLRAAQGDGDRALADFREARRRLGPSSQTINGVNLSARTAETLHALRRDDEARAESSATLAIARRFGAATAFGGALRVHGLLTDDPAVLREAVDVLRSSPARLEEARAHVDLGAHLRRHGARRDARKQLRAGHELAVACGAHPLAHRARAELAASGIRLVARDPERRDELTTSEHRIARMAADGATNRDIAQALFLTVKTVEMHLSNTYRKLDIRSRRELHTALAAHAQDQAN